MKRIEYTCDHCGITVSNEMLPDEWYCLGYLVPEEGWRITHHFCGFNCLDTAVKVEKGMSHPDNDVA